MTFNKHQKISSIVYSILLICILLFFTPYKNIHNHYDYFDSFFSDTNGQIQYLKLIIELFVLTVFYVLSIIFLNSNKKI